MELAIMSPLVSASSLTRQCWGYLLVEKISGIEWVEDAYGNLHLDGKRKESVRRLMQEHRERRTMIDDVG
ncbi:hypothetical protein LZ30DRAFT_719873 [Colletotrichum cereale]|nr:hypothetical protein LZ30DRAFT_719873 [Colletotrichum cereale]